MSEYVSKEAAVAAAMEAVTGTYIARKWADVDDYRFKATQAVAAAIDALPAEERWEKLRAVLEDRVRLIEGLWQGNDSKEAAAVKDLSLATIKFVLADMNEIAPSPEPERGENETEMKMLREDNRRLKAKCEKLANATTLNGLSQQCHEANAKWWHDINTGERIVRNKGELICLMHSELSEAMEGERKNLMDDKLPHRKMAEVELVDTLIRIFDYAGAYGYDLDGAFREKMAYNASRADHSHEARKLAGGKKW